MHFKSEISGAAALTICESLLICLYENRVLSNKQIAGLLQDAANAQLGAAEQEISGDTHRLIADLITQIAAGRNSTR